MFMLYSRHCLALLIFVTVTPFAGCTTEESAEESVEVSTVSFRIMAYNIHHGEGMDEVLDLERIAELINRESPDLVALQEVDSMAERTGGVDQAAVLGRLTGMYHAFGRFMPYQGGAYGMAVLSKWPFEQVRNLRLPDGEEPRTSLVVTVQPPEYDGRFHFAGIHFYMTEEERMAQARATVDLLGTSDEPIILAGDFNSEPGTAVIEFLDQDWHRIDKGDDHFTFSAAKPVKEIDFVYFRPESRFDVLSNRLLDEPIMSDHRPYVVDFTVR